MLHTLLQLTRPLVVFDTETTGSNAQTARIVELGFKIYTAEGLVREWRSLVNPGIPIPREVTEVHGITDDTVNSCRNCMHRWPDLAELSGPDACVCEGVFKPWPRFHNIARSLARGFSECDFAGQNIRYDLQIVAEEMKRVGVPWTYTNASIVDTGRLEQLVEPRSLSHLYQKYTGRALEDAHGALADVSAVVDVLGNQLERHRDLPRTVAELHRLQWPNWIDVEGKFRFVNGVPTCGFGKHRGDAMSAIPRGFYDWILRNDFSDEIKTLARNAKLGVFPTPTALPGEDDVI